MDSSKIAFAAHLERKFDTGKRSARFREIHRPLCAETSASHASASTRLCANASPATRLRHNASETQRVYSNASPPTRLRQRV